MSHEHNPDVKHRERLPDDLRPLEAMLASLVPSRDRLDQQQLWFEAGRQSVLRSATPRTARWKVAGASTASAVVGIAATLLVVVGMRPTVATTQRSEQVAATIGEADPVQTDPAGEAAPAGAGQTSDGPTAVVAPAEPGMATAEAHGFRDPQFETYGLLLRHGASLTDPPRRTAALSADQHSSGLRDDFPTYYQQRQALIGGQRGADLQLNAHRTPAPGA